MNPSRRRVLQALTAAAAASAAPPGLARIRAAKPQQATRRATPPGLRLGLVTYLWGADLKLDDLLAACSAGGLAGIEFRTTHAHGIERSLSAAQRKEVRAKLADSSMDWFGIGSDERFDNPDPLRLARAVVATMDFLKLSADVGASGVKVKPDSFHPGVEHKKTIEQIGTALNAVGRYAAELGQELRMEAHGSCAELPTIAAILQVADHPSVKVVWNCNDQDLQGKGLAHNFALVRPRFGEVLHLRAFDRHPYPYPELFDLLLASDYQGLALLEARGVLPVDRGAGFARQRALFEQHLADARIRARQG